MTIRDLGVLDGEVLVFGGPYSNLQALEALITEAERRQIPPKRMICTGDVVAYCADAATCVQTIQALGCPVVAGNCEVQIAEGAQDCGCGFEAGTACSLLSGTWFAHASSQVDTEGRAWMASLPPWIVFTLHGRRHVVIHGGADRINRFIWPNAAEAELSGQIRLLEAEVGPVDVVLCGHSGLSFIRKVDDVTWVNAGVIGLPENDGRAETRFVTLSPEPEIHLLGYDARSARAAMERAGLTQGYHTTLTDGFWPSEDVLPPDLRRVA